MKLFITYASDDRPVADELAVRLRTEGHTVFMDKDNLPEAEGYDAAIREAIADCDVYVFLISPNSLKAGRYTLTEMKLAREQFPNPHGRVLPVMIAPTPFRDIPAYLSAVTVLQPEGNTVAETVARIGEIEARRKRNSLVRMSALAGVLAAFVGGAVWLSSGFGEGKDESKGEGEGGGGELVASSCQLAVELPAGMVEAGLALDVSTPAGTQAYVLSASPLAIELTSVSRDKGEAWAILLRSRDGSELGKKELSGCPASRTWIDFGEGYGLELAPK